MSDTDVFIISAVRSAIGLGREKGALYPLAPVDLAAQVMEAAIRRAGIAPKRIDDVIWGIVTPIGDQGANMARLAALKAGFPVEVPAVSINRMCGSSQQAVHFAAQAILAGDAGLVLAGGTEMMSHQVLGADYPEAWPQDFPYDLVHQGTSAEMMAEKWSLTRDEQDDFAFRSHEKAAAAIDAGYFNDQIIPLPLPSGEVFSTDEGVRRPPDREKMRTIKPAFKADGTVTAGNASQISDGAGALLLASAEAVGRYNLMPIARVLTRTAVGTDPILALDGTIAATRKVLEMTNGLTLDDMDLIEINEAFASVVLAWAKELDANMEKVNVNGGAIAHGHPLGATGAILMTKLVHEMQRRQARFGLQTMCIGHGMATATILERV
ncbi:MAG: thiolase family protein [Anaerolineales bacterium]|uniref:Thiolase family protein n=1 Tax=Candidatus Desulfolinea nitratireducens TaxID=2841698 RepID=A0A8J6NEJ7_9CHLR|nr:thiolase family protein [Candidatus Desulfolinea nitratireducens]MBL6962083.1 thiolase family protein [Anaerolineales bacterium]